MQSSSQETPGGAESDLFSPAWLTSDPISRVLNSAPMGVARLESVRNESEAIVDFTYHLANPIQRALTQHAEWDLVGHSLIVLNPDVVKMGMLERLIHVATTGQPLQHVENYHLDGLIGRYDQLYLKSGDGVLMLVQDVTYSPLSADEQQQQAALMAAIASDHAVAALHAMLIALISGQRP